MATKRAAKPKPIPAPIVWTRADPVLLAQFDPRTKQCTMNCGPHSADPRTAAERLFLCDDCYIVQPPSPSAP